MIIYEAYNYTPDTKVIKDDLYPVVETAFKSSKTLRQYKEIISKFISDRAEDLYDTLPCSRLLCGSADMDPLFNCIGISQYEVESVINRTYYGPVDNFNPKAAKDPFTVLQLCVVKYFSDHNQQKELELSLIYLSFSGKFYPSIHYRSYPDVLPARHIMEYVINNRLSKKYNIVSEGSVMNAIKSIGLTWVKSYKNKFKSFEDEDVVYLVQQLHSRIGSFTKNIASEYYKVYENKDNYFNYTSDNYNSDNYHIADSDILRAQKVTEATMSRITSSGIDYNACRQCADENITVNEIQNIIQAILSDKKLIIEVKELISLMVTSYYAQSDSKDVSDISFLTYSISSKPNTKQKEIIRQKEIIEGWLCEKSPAYIRRRSRNATRNSYERAVRTYFALAIHNANR